MKNLLWLPLSLSIFGVDLIQRGFATFAKAKDFMIPHIGEALSIYFLVMSLGVLIGGFVCDNMNSRKVLLWATIVGALGILTVPYTPWGFGLIFGSAAAFIKIAPFSGPLKLYDTTNDAMLISPQAAAKNFGGALFTLFFATIFIGMGWIWATGILASLFILSGISTYYMMPDDKIEGWKLTIIKDLAKDFKFWAAMVYFFLMSGLYYMVIFGFYPALKDAGFDKLKTATIIAISFLICGFLRFFVAWLGNIKYNGHSIRLPLMWGGTAGMASCLFLTPISPIFSLAVFTFMSAIHTPNYWAYCKEMWGPKYISTVLGLAFFFMYLGSGVMYGAWIK